MFSLMFRGLALMHLKRNEEAEKVWPRLEVVADRPVLCPRISFTADKCTCDQGYSQAVSGDEIMGQAGSIS
jgi:hypothetical protein